MLKLKVALEKKGDSGDYTFSRAWTVPATVLHFLVCQLALKNIKFLVADDKMERDDRLIGSPVLCHLYVDAKTLLEKQ